MKIHFQFQIKTPEANLASGMKLLLEAVLSRTGYGTTETMRLAAASQRRSWTRRYIQRPLLRSLVRAAR
jgi:hypothetical protein